MLDFARPADGNQAELGRRASQGWAADWGLMTRGVSDRDEAGLVFDVFGFYRLTASVTHRLAGNDRRYRHTGRLFAAHN